MVPYTSIYRLKCLLALDHSFGLKFYGQGVCATLDAPYSQTDPGRPSRFFSLYVISVCVYLLCSLFSQFVRCAPKLTLIAAYLRNLFNLFVEVGFPAFMRSASMILKTTCKLWVASPINNRGLITNIPGRWEWRINIKESAPSWSPNSTYLYLSTLQIQKT